MTGSRGNAGADAAELERINLGVADWEQRRDEGSIAEISKVIAEDLIFRRADGEVVDVDRLMAGLEGDSPFVERTPSAPAIEVRGDRALAVIVATRKADGATGRFRNIRFFRRDDGAWRLYAWFNDPLVNAIVGGGPG